MKCHMEKKMTKKVNFEKSFEKHLKILALSGKKKFRKKY